MILVSVGTSEFEFNRLFKVIDDLCDKEIINKNKIIAQTGYTKYKPKNYKYFNFIEKDEFDNYINNSEFIIMHAGVGTIINALKKGKKIIVFPRLQEYKEHVDNHQLEIAKLFAEKEYIIVAQNLDEMANAVSNIKNFTPKTFESGNKKINELIDNYIQNI